MHPEARIRRVATILLLVAVSIACLTACADTTPGKYRLQLSGEQQQELQSYRVWLGIVFAVQYVLMLWGARKLNEPQRTRMLISMLLLLPLSWTKLGEWGYRLSAWMFGWGVFGKGFVVLLSLLSGLNGVGNVSLYVLCAFVFDNIELLRWGVLPFLIVSVLVGFVVFTKASSR